MESGRREGLRSIVLMLMNFVSSVELFNIGVEYALLGF